VPQWPKVLAELSDEDRCILESIQAIGWYPVEPVLRHHHALERVFGRPRGRSMVRWTI
jgi:hypothetical protein